MDTYLAWELRSSPRLTPSVVVRAYRFGEPPSCCSIGMLFFMGKQESHLVKFPSEACQDDDGLPCACESEFGIETAHTEYYVHKCDCI